MKSFLPDILNAKNNDRLIYAVHGLLNDYCNYKAGTGTITVTNGSKDVTGQGSLFTTEIDLSKPCKIITATGNEYTVASITNATGLKLTENATATESTVVYYINNQVSPVTSGYPITEKWRSTEVCFIPQNFQDFDNRGAIQKIDIEVTIFSDSLTALMENVNIIRKININRSNNVVYENTFFERVFCTDIQRKEDIQYNSKWYYRYVIILSVVTKNNNF